MLRGSSWMMLIGGIVLLLGLVFYAWGVSLYTTTATKTLVPGESITTELSAEDGDLILVFINVHDPGPGVIIREVTQHPSGSQYGITGSGGSRFTGTSQAGETGLYTIVIENIGVRAVTIDYGVTTTSSTEMTLVRAGVPLALTGFFIVVGGLGLRFIWRGQRGYPES